MTDQPTGSIVRNAIEIVAFVAIVVADAMGLVPLTQTIFLLPLIWLSLRRLLSHSSMPEGILASVS